MTDKKTITVEVTVNAPAEKVWDIFNAPEHIVNWASASPDWHTTKSENDVRVGGKFNNRMEAKDGSFGFDFTGTYDAVEPHKHIAYTMDDGRQVSINISSDGNTTTFTETFDPENENPIEMQRMGWQAILDSFKNYTEKN